MTNTRLRLTPSEFGALWTYLKSGTEKHAYGLGFAFFHSDTPYGFQQWNHIELIEEHNPDFRPIYYNGILHVHPLFKTWLECDGDNMALLKAIQ